MRPLPGRQEPGEKLVLPISNGQQNPTQARLSGDPADIQRSNGSLVAGDAWQEMCVNLA